MKKIMIYCVATLYFMATAQAQCPTSIVDDNGDGTRYRLLLANVAQCGNFPVPSTILLRGQSYGVTSCAENVGIVTVNLSFDNRAGEAPVPLAINAPLTIPVGGTNCRYNSTGQLITALCPTQTSDDGGRGVTYKLTLANLDQCANYPVPTTILLQGQSYGVTSCSENFGIVTVNLGFIGTAGNVPVQLATTAPLVIPIGGNSCVFNTSGNPIVLPIELIDFKGTPSVSGNVLTWTTVREVSSRGFQVERLTADTKWVPLSFVKSKGAYGKYEFTDYNPLQTSYYRLRQLDNDGMETFSKIVTIAQTGKGKGLKVYPNPVLNTLTVENTEGSDFQILNLLGQQVLTGKTPPSGAGGLDVSTLPQGTYILKVGTEQAKFVKQ
jgi:hypothetical protein